MLARSWRALPSDVRGGQENRPRSLTYGLGRVSKKMLPMTALLEKAIAKTQALPAAEQDRLAALLLQEIETAEGEGQGASARSLWDEILEIVEAAPEEVWEAVPKDGAAEHDHYLYGMPKRSP
ncbi:MAG: hypothetical protein ACR2GR_05855 [Rhodothermales bacterium]